jgi:hypothetical protein
MDLDNLASYCVGGLVRPSPPMVPSLRLEWFTSGIPRPSVFVPDGVGVEFATGLKGNRKLIISHRVRLVDACDGRSFSGNDLEPPLKSRQMKRAWRPPRSSNYRHTIHRILQKQSRHPTISRLCRLSVGLSPANAARLKFTYVMNNGTAT